MRQISLHRLTREKSHLIKYILFFIPELISLYKLIKKEQVNIVHCNGSWQIKGVVAGKLAGAKVIWHLNDTHIPALINIIFNFLASRFCDAFIVAGERVKDYYLNNKKDLKKQLTTIQAPVDTSIFDPQKVKEDKKIAQFQGIKIVTIGNINPLKGVEYFVEMASILNARHNNLFFFVVGTHLSNQKKYSEKILNMVKKFQLKNLHFYGWSDQIPSILKSADIYVCPSISEASPISIWEAMAMAKPIVTSNVGDVNRFIKNGENGFVVPVKDAVALAEKVALLIENKELRIKFGAKNREIAVEHLDVEICAKKHAQFYREVMNKK